MKNYLLISMALIFVLNSCSEGSVNSAKQPNDIGVQVMDLLNVMGDITKPEFSEYFISAKELKEIAENKDLGIEEEQQRIMSTTTREAMKIRYNFMFKRLKRSGKRIGLNWEKAEFVDFNFEIKSQGGAKFCYGELQFKYRNEVFSVNTTSVFDGEKYILSSVDQLGKAN
ncbi:MAG: hypothetical protein Crog4KO_13160 [Crocinitomicaceae bacterium]